MSEPFNIKKVFDFTPTSLGKSLSVVLKAVIVLVVVIGVPWLAYERGRAKGYSQCAKDRPTTGITGDVGTLNQDCSKQVCAAINETEIRNKQKQPWVDLDFKILRFTIPGKR